MSALPINIYLILCSPEKPCLDGRATNQFFSQTNLSTRRSTQRISKQYQIIKWGPKNSGKEKYNIKEILWVSNSNEE